MAVHRRAPALRHYGAVLALALAAACNSAPEKPDNSLVCKLYAGQGSRTEVLVSGTVARVLGERRGPSGEHEGYLLQLDGGCDLLLRVETNTTLTGPMPLRRNERVTVKGEYEYSPEGGVLHWTHHDPAGKHVNGYVEAGGTYYR